MVIGFFFGAFVLIMIYLTLINLHNIIRLVYANRMEKSKCECVSKQHLNYLKLYSYISLVTSLPMFIIMGQFGTMEIDNKNHPEYLFIKMLLRVHYILQCLFIVYEIWFVSEIVKNKCSCGDTHGRRTLLAFSIMNLVIYIMSFLRYIFVTLSSSNYEEKLVKILDNTGRGDYNLI